MKLVPLLLCLLSPWPLFADGLFSLFEPKASNIDFGTTISDREVSTLIEILDAKSWSSHQPVVTEIATKIPLNTKYALYDKYKISGTWGLLNLYGVGSFFQGDPGTSLITIGGIAAGEAIAIGSSNVLRDRPERNVWMATGVTVAVGSLVYGLIRPWFYADERNRDLRRSLFEADR